MSDWIEQIPTAWGGHRAFADALVKHQGIETVIELGVHYGYSMFVFANAGVKKIYGIDLWEDDMGFNYGNFYQQLQQLVEEHQLTDIVHLIKGDFNEVVKTWPHGRVDLLHIDGTHVYEDVKEDFEKWLPHVKDDGIVLLHDVCVEKFTVKQFFNEICLPKAWFPHCFGLGVVCRTEQKLQELKNRFPNLKIGNIPV